MVNTPCQLCGVRHNFDSAVRFEHEAQLAARKGRSFSSGIKGAMASLIPDRRTQKSVAVTDAFHDPWSSDEYEGEPQPFPGSEEARNNPGVRYYLDGRDSVLVKRQPLKYGEDGQYDMHISEENYHAIEYMAAQARTIPLHIHHNGHTHVNDPMPVDEDGNQLVIDDNGDFKDNLYVISSDGTEARKIPAGSDISAIDVTGGAYLGSLTHSPQGVVMEYLGDPRTVNDMNHVWESSAAMAGAIQARLRESPDQTYSQTYIPCLYCGRSHLPTSIVHHEHAAYIALRQNQMMNGDRAVDMERRRLANMVYDDLVVQARENADFAQNIRADENQAVSMEKQIAAYDTEGEAAQGSNGTPSPAEFGALRMARIAEEKFKSEHPDLVSDDPTQYARNPGSENVYYSALAAQSTPDDNPAWSTPKNMFVKGMDPDLPAPALPGNFGAMHVPSLIASIGGFGTDAMRNGEYIFHGNPVVRASRADRIKAVKAASEWMINQELWRRGIEPGTWDARRFLKKNRALVDHFEGSARDSMMATAKMRALYRHDSKKYAPGSPRLREAYDRELRRLERKREIGNGSRPITKTDFLLNVLRNSRSGGPSGGWKYTKMFLRNRGRKKVSQMIGVGMFRLG